MRKLTRDSHLTLYVILCLTIASTLFQRPKRSKNLLDCRPIWKVSKMCLVWERFSKYWFSWKSWYDNVGICVVFTGNCGMCFVKSVHFVGTSASYRLWHIFCNRIRVVRKYGCVTLPVPEKLTKPLFYILEDNNLISDFFFKNLLCYISF